MTADDSDFQRYVGAFGSLNLDFEAPEEAANLQDAQDAYDLMGSLDQTIDPAFSYDDDTVGVGQFVRDELPFVPLLGADGTSLS